MKINNSALLITTVFFLVLGLPQASAWVGDYTHRQCTTWTNPSGLEIANLSVNISADVVALGASDFEDMTWGGEDQEYNWWCEWMECNPSSNTTFIIHLADNMTTANTTKVCLYMNSTGGDSINESNITHAGFVGDDFDDNDISDYGTGTGGFTTVCSNAAGGSVSGGELIGASGVDNACHFKSFNEVRADGYRYWLRDYTGNFRGTTTMLFKDGDGSLGGALRPTHDDSDQYRVDSYTTLTVRWADNYNSDANTYYLFTMGRKMSDDTYFGIVDKTNVMDWDKGNNADSTYTIFNNISVGVRDAAGDPAKIDYYLYGVWCDYCSYTWDAIESTAEAPSWSSPSVSPSSPQTWPVESATFSVTWTDDGTVDSGWIEHDFSGSNTTYPMTNASDVYSYTGGNWSAGTFNYRFHANDTEGNTNQSGWYTYVINKQAIQLNLTLNGSESNLSITFLESVNITAWTNISGVNATIHRNSTIITNPTVYNPGYGSLNLSAFVDHENYTATAKTYWTFISKAASGLTLSASPSWTSAEDSTVTITCSANAPLVTTLTFDDVTVTSPYIATHDFGIYSVACTISDTFNYTPASSSNTLTISSGGFGCTNTETFAFEANFTVNTSVSNQTVLDFSDLVDEYLVRSDLGDVYPVTNNTPGGWINGSLFVANVTGLTSLTVRFANNVVDYNWNSTANTTSHTDFNYTTINQYMKLTFVDERTGGIQLPPNANHTLFIFCSGGISSHNISSDRMTVATFERADEINARVQYSVTEIYARNYEISADVETMNVYLVDADEDQVVQILLSLQDATGDFDNSLLKAKKYIEGTQRTITEHFFDAEAKVIVYLINGDKYTLFVDNGDEERSIGYLYVDSVDLSKTLTIGEVLTTNQTHGNLSFGFYNTTNSIVFALVDGSGLTSSAEMWIYNETDDLIYYTNSTNKTAIEFTYAVSNTTHEYSVRVKIHHATFGENSIDLWAPFFGAVISLENPVSIFNDAGLVGDIPGANGATFEDLAGVGTIIGAAFLFTATTGPIGGIIAALVAGMLVYFGWYGINIAIIAVALILAVINKMTEDRRVG